MGFTGVEVSDSKHRVGILIKVFGTLQKCRVLLGRIYVDQAWESGT